LFDNDLLAPLVGGALFPDFLQRLLPVPAKAFDRARALEQGFSEACDHAADWLGTDSTLCFDGKRFFLPLGWSLSYRSLRTISSSTASSLAAQLVEAELEGRDTDELKGRKPKVAEQ
jgi:hypothetical protein